MGNYISRDEFAKYLADIQYGEAPTGRTGENIDYQNGVYAGFDMAYVALERFPAADVRPVRRGKWIDHQEGRWIYAKCSECETVHDVRSNFCPNCGADMRPERMADIPSEGD